MIKLSTFSLLALAFFGIIFYMGIFTWGSAPKDQTNPQLITEAITAGIVAHEADPTAHLGAGESLEQHKSNEVLDHLAGSVKNDKTSFNNFIYDLKFSDYAIWSKYKNGADYSFHTYLSGIYFETYPSTASAYNRLYKYHINNFAQNSSFYISANILSENTPHSSQYWSFGLFDSYLTKDRVNGFVYKTGKLYCALFNAVGEINFNHELVGVNLFDNTEHNLRLYYLATENVYRWYIDGLLVYEYDNSGNIHPENYLNGSGGFDFQFTFDADTDFLLYNYDYILAVDLTY